MKMKQNPEDFIVEEIHGNGISTINYPLKQRISDSLPKKRKRYLNCDMVKRNYTTQRAILKIAKVMGISKKRISYAGTKDKKALTSQRISIENGELKKIDVKDIKLKNFNYADKKLRMGDLIGNRFTITLRDIGIPNIIQSVNRFIENSKSGISNYFGEQRFGNRGNNHIIGKRIIQGDFECAVKLFLTDTINEKEDIKDARNWLGKNWGDWKGALKRYSKVLGLERTLLEYLEKNKRDFIGALKNMPKRFALIFIHAYQSHIFNACLERDQIARELPLVGYKTKVSGILKDVLEEEKIEPSDFRIKQISWLSCKGSSRKTLFFPEDFRISNIKDDSVTLRFTLSSGSYATVLIRELSRALGDYVEG